MNRVRQTRQPILEHEIADAVKQCRDRRFLDDTSRHQYDGGVGKVLTQCCDCRLEVEVRYSGIVQDRIPVSIKSLAQLLGLVDLNQLEIGNRSHQPTPNHQLIGTAVVDQKQLESGQFTHLAIEWISRSKLKIGHVRAERTATRQSYAVSPHLSPPTGCAYASNRVAR